MRSNSAVLLLLSLLSLSLLAGPVAAQIPQDPAKLALALKGATSPPPGMSAEQRRMLDATVAALRADPDASGSAVRMQFAAFAKSYIQRADAKRLTQAVLYAAMAAARPQDRAALEAQIKQAKDAAEAASTAAESSSKSGGTESANPEQKRTMSRFGDICAKLYAAGLPPDDKGI